MRSMRRARRVDSSTSTSTALNCTGRALLGDGQPRRHAGEEAPQHRLDLVADDRLRRPHHADVGHVRRAARQDARVRRRHVRVRAEHGRRRGRPGSGPSPASRSSPQRAYRRRRSRRSATLCERGVGGAERVVDLGHERAALEVEHRHALLRQHAAARRRRRVVERPQDRRLLIDDREDLFLVPDVVARGDARRRPRRTAPAPSAASARGRPRRSRRSR